MDFHKEETTKIDKGPTIACIIFQLCIMVPPNCSNLDVFHVFHLSRVAIVWVFSTAAAALYIETSFLGTVLPGSCTILQNK